MKKINILYAHAQDQSGVEQQISKLIDYAESIELHNFWLFRDFPGSEPKQTLDSLIENNVKKARIDTIYVTNKSILNSDIYSAELIYSLLNQYNVKLVAILN